MGKKAITMKRHYGRLSPAEEDDLVGIVADLIVNFMQGGRAQETTEARRHGVAMGNTRSRCREDRESDDE